MGKPSSISTCDLRAKRYALSSGFHPQDREVDSAHSRGALGEIRFGLHDASEGARPRIPVCAAPLASLQPQADVERWLSSAAPVYESHGALRLAHDGTTLFGAVSLSDPEDRLEAVTREIYRDILDSVQKLGYPQLLRIWNFFPRINAIGAQGLERYRAFCKGRHLAFFEDRRYREERLPAGTGVGCREPIMGVAFLASRAGRVVNIENPRQAPAFHYPARYGPKSPSFSRGALILRDGGGAELYVSGTASIVGHESLYPDDVVAQCTVALDNIEALLTKANLARYGASLSAGLEDLRQVKVYIRRDEDFPLVKSLCETRLSPDADILYLGADICRAELLVEIEGSVRWSG